MRNIFELSKYDLWWLEDKFSRYNQLDKEIAIRKEELKIKQTDENIGGGKSNTVSSPVENEVLKALNDEYIREREKWKKAIDSVYKQSTETEQKIIRDKFWSDTNYLSWQEVGALNDKARTQIYEIRYSILQRFAKKIGYI